MKCAIMQPTYLPWLGFFDLIRSVDIFVIYDSVQFEKQSWQQRNRIRDAKGEIMLTLSVKHGAGLERLIKDVKIDTSGSILKKHLTSIRLAYSRSVNFDLVYPDLEAVFNGKYEYLTEINLDLIKVGMKHLGIQKDLIFSRDMNVKGNKVEALVDICKKIKADSYLSPVGSKDYIDKNNIFSANGIELSYQNFDHPVYPQLSAPDFISHLSFIDYLFNMPSQKAVLFGLNKTSC